MCRLILILLFVLPLPLLAQQYNFNSWSVEHGLPQSQVYDLIETKQGNLCLATLGGVSRFDGITFKNLTKTNGLRSNSIKSVYEDSKGYFWFGSFDAGLCRYDGQKIVCFGPKDGIPDGGIYDITEDLNHNLLVSTNQGMRILKEGRFEVFGREAGLPQEKFWAILADSKGDFWATTLGNGIYRISNNKTTRYALEQGLLNKITYSVYQDAKGQIWFGHYGGLSRFTGNGFQNFMPDGDRNLNRVWDITSDKSGGLWLALDGGGILRFDGKNFTRITEENGLKSNFVNRIVNDKEGNIWIGTSGGLQQLTAMHFVHYTAENGLKPAHVTALAIDKSGKKWIGTLGGGAALFDGKNFTWYNTHNTLANDNVNDIKITSDGTVWLATSAGLTRYQHNQFKTFTEADGLASNVTTFCLPTSGNGLWVGTHHGLSYFNGQEFTNYQHRTDKNYNRINTILTDSQNQVWVGTVGGLGLVKDGKIESVPVPGLAAKRSVNAMVQDKNGTLWLGCYGNGLVPYQPDKPKPAGQPQIYTLQNGLLSEEINSLLIDTKQQLWIGTIKGLARVSLAELKANPNKPAFKDYTYHNGFRGIEVTENTIAEAPNGTLWFGTVKGLTSYLPGGDRPNAAAPQLSLRKVKLFLQDVDWAEQGKKLDNATDLPKDLKLAYDQNHLTFVYHATSLTNPAGVRYSFKLNGFDRAWSVPTTATQATYSNLEPGTYTFAVKSMNSDGVWNKEPITYTFTITPPVWNNLWFLGLVLSLTAAGVFSLVRMRENNYKKLNNLLEQKVDHRTKMLEEKNREKEVLIKEIHHRVKNNLQIITSMLNLQARYIKDEQALQVVREVKDRVKAMSTIHQRLYRRDELADLDFPSYISGICKSLFISYGISEEQIKLDCRIPAIKLDIDTAVTLGLIINEVVSNTLKYAFPYNRKGTLLVELIPLTADLYQLTIADNGVGLPPDFDEKKQYSFGLQLISSLSRKLDGKLNFYSENGTQVKLIFHTFN